MPITMEKPGNDIFRDVSNLATKSVEFYDLTKYLPYFRRFTRRHIVSLRLRAGRTNPTKCPGCQ